jgi:hypothetical protein
LDFTDRPALPQKLVDTLQVLKTQRRQVSTLPIGPWIAHETIWRDPATDQAYGSAQLRRLVAPGCTFGYDVLVLVGQELFLHHRPTEAVVEQLREGQIPISPSEVGYLARKFVVYLALAHRQSAPTLKKAMQAQGGYILHLDGTCEGGGPMLMSSLDGLSQIVLGSVKLPSEKAEQIIPFLQEIKARFGRPIATVHDMGTGILRAIHEVFPGVPDFICHFHFLRDVGKDLLEADYEALRQRLRKHGLGQKLLYRARRLKSTLDQQPEVMEGFCHSVQQGHWPPSAQLESFPLLCAYSLIQWALESKRGSEGYGFPFDRPQVEWAHRMLVLGERLEQIKDIHLRGQWTDNKPLLRLSCELRNLCADAGLARRLAALDEKIQVFDQLRSAMRIAPTGGGAGLNSGSEAVALGPIEKAVEKFRQQITSRADYDSNDGWKAMVAQIDKYQEKLFADPITVRTPHGPLVIQPQRTNNIMERFFRDLRRGARHRTGNNRIGRFLQSMIADTPLVRNLENPAYLKILLNGQATLEERFAQIDVETVRKELAAARASVEKVPLKIRQLIALPSFPEDVCRLFKNAA